MIYRKALFTIAVVLFLNVSFLFAGDTATFADLGFSPDGKTYMFAQYGVQSGTLKPWADMFIVDVARNNFTGDGRISYVHDTPVISGQDGSGAFYRLIAKNGNLADKYRVNFCLQGQPLFISLDSTASAGTQAPVEFRDFDSGASYRATLVPYIEGSGTDLKSSFYITLESTSRDGSKKTYTVGTPQLKRPLIASYRIRKVITAPNDGSMIFIIEMKRQSGQDFDIRFMVEALRL